MKKTFIFITMFVLIFNVFCFSIFASLNSFNGSKLEQIENYTEDVNKYRHKAELNEIYFYSTPEEKTALILGEISKAQKLVQIDSFLFGQTIGKQIIEALKERRKHGVEVRLLFDENLGIGGPTRKFFLEILDMIDKETDLTYKLYPLKTLPKLIDTPFSNKFQIDHNKLIVIDKKTLIIGGVNFFDYGILNRDPILKITGPTAYYMSDRMNIDWNLRGSKADDTNLNIKPYNPKSDNKVKVQVLETSEKESSIKPSIINLINLSKKSVYIEILDFFDKDIINALVSAKRRGVDVRVIMDRKDENTNSKYTDMKISLLPNSIPNIATADLLLKEDINIRFYNPPFKNQELHTKICLVDNDKYILGSSNFTRQSFTTFRETSVEIIGGETAKLLKDFFMEDWNHRSSICEKPNSMEDLKILLINFFDENYLGWW